MAKVLSATEIASLRAYLSAGANLKNPTTGTFATWDSKFVRETLPALIEAAENRALLERYGVL